MALSLRRGRGGARLEDALHVVVQRRDAEHHAHQAVARQLREQVDIARDQRALGGDR